MTSAIDKGVASTRLSLYARLITVPAIWGGTFIAGRVTAQQLPPAFGSAVRYALACVALLMAVKWLEGGLPRLTRRQLMVTIAMGATGIFAYSLFFLSALSYLPASRTSLLIALSPITTSLIAVGLLGERLSALRWLGVVLGVTGVWIVISHGDITSTLGRAIGHGELLMLCGVVAWSAYTLIGRVALEGLSPLVATTYASLWGAAMLACVAIFDLPLVRLEQFTPAVIASTLYLGFLGTALAFVWYSLGVKQIGASRTVIFNNLVPVFGACFGVLLLDEPFRLSMLVGGVVAVTGVMLASRGR